MTIPRFQQTLLAGILWLASLTPGSFAQVASGAGSISGTIADSSGANIAGAAVNVIHVSTQVTRSTVTDSEGRYYALSLPPGEYEVQVRVSGFREALRKGIEITIGRAAVVDIQMELGEISQRVEVTGAPPLIESSNATIGEVISNEKIVALPLNGRSFAQLALLVPQVVTGGVGTGNTGIQNTSISTQGSLSISGGRSEAAQFTFNGINVNNEFIGGTLVYPPIDALEEFKIEQNVYSAELGGRVGQVILSSKAGTNALHGSAYEFLRNDKLDANNFFLNRAGVAKRPLKQNQFGASVGGPIIRNRTFGFFNWESARVRRGTPVTLTQPTAAMRTGDFSELLPARVIRDPQTGAPFSGNLIAAGRISPIALNSIRLSQYPLPNASGVRNNFTVTPTSQPDLNQYIGRVDHNFSSKDQLWGSYYWTRLSQLDPRTTLAGDTLIASTVQTGTLQHTHIFGPSLINTVRLGYTLGSQDQPNLSPSGITNADLGFPNNGNQPRASGISAGIPLFTITGYGAAGAPNNSPRLFKTQKMQLGDTLNWIRGAHVLKVGGDYTRRHEDQRFNPQIRGSYTFTQNYTGDGFADFLLGLPGTATRELLLPTSNIFESLHRSSHYYFFMQDDWKVKPNLTLNAGLRYEYNGQLYEDRDRLANFVPLNGAVVRLDAPGSNGPGLKDPQYGRCLCFTKKRDFGPRFGLAYRPRGSNKTVIRSGYGIFFVNVPFNKRQADAFNFPWIERQIVTNTTPNPVFDLANTFLPSVVTSGILGFRSDLDYFDPMIQQWNFSVQRQVAAKTMVEISYTGSISVHLDGARTFNSARPGAGAFGPRRPLPNQPVVTSVDHGYRSSYHGFTTKVRRDFSQGLTFLGHYTWSKALDTASSQTGYIAQDHNCADCNKGLSGFNVAHRVIGSVVYELPVGRGRKHLSSAPRGVDFLLGGWTVSFIQTLQSGFYTSAITTRNTANIEAGTLFPDVVEEFRLSKGSRTVDRWFNTSGFAQPGAFLFGTAGRNIIEGPGLKSTDFGIHKNFAITERHRLQFRVEAFNGLNNVNFALPQNNLAAADFGTIVAAGPSREMQLGLKYIF
ncbi:MAG TPA: carboxypeptidase regulatory-like domain-containing protein [Bryobacteraceae bacterium]|nr:carboxypeptidase regulatory-like domain-containing protein [Bryobacteraceae bacterium]